MAQKYPNFETENNLWKQGYELIAGVDEVGRGAWAGPVVAGAVVWQKSTVVKGMRDSKQLKADDRERLVQTIMNQALFYAIGEATNREVDENGIVVATMLAMERALENLAAKPDFVLVDALKLRWRGVVSQAIIKGDQKSISIAAASILAKVWRDNLMNNLQNKYSNYCFSKHKGYGTKLHQMEIAKSGLCEIHRISFKCFKVKVKGLFNEQ